MINEIKLLGLGIIMYLNHCDGHQHFPFIESCDMCKVK